MRKDIPAEVLGEIPPNWPSGPPIIWLATRCIAAVAALRVCDEPASRAAAWEAKFNVA